MTGPAPNLPAFALFAALLSAAGIPIYIHAPKFYVDEFGVSLSAMFGVLLGLRMLDVIQDPLLGKLSARLRDHRRLTVAGASLVMALAMLGLFALRPPISPVLWFALMLTLVFSAFSFLTINFYAQGVTTATRLGAQGHLRLARWRETGALLGICVAAVAPVALSTVLAGPYAGFALGFAALAVIATVAMQSEWRGPDKTPPPTRFATIWSDRLARRLLIIALVNAAPVAVSSTLFLYFVESRLAAPGKEGILLLLFFLSAAVSSPLWSLAAERFGAKPVLQCAMVLAIVTFGFAVTLGPGDWVLFAVICMASGATMGADLTLLPAIFARRMAVISPQASEGFGLWSFVSKLTLGLAAILLPILEAAGFESGAQTNPEAALILLSWLYAGVPCALKLIAILVLSLTSLKEA